MYENVKKIGHREFDLSGTLNDQNSNMTFDPIKLFCEKMDGYSKCEKRHETLEPTGS